MQWQAFNGTDQEWDSLVAEFSYAQFTQSSAWKNFQESLGRKVKRLMIQSDDSEVAALCQLVFIKKSIGSYWLAQRGPVLSQEIDTMDAMNALAKQVPDLLDDGAWFVRVEPVPHMDEPHAKLAEPWLRKKSYDPSVTRMIDLTQDEEVIQAQMHQKTRYNIRIGQKHNVEVHRSNQIKDFLLLQKETAARDHFVAQSDEYVTKQFEALHKDGLATLMIAQHQKAVLAANVMIQFGDTMTYLYGASSSTQRNVMAPYILHWESMRLAKSLGYRHYDLWGINPIDSNHIDFKSAWEGITRFKAGWGGQIIELPGTYDLPVNTWLYRFAQLIKRI